MKTAILALALAAALAAPATVRSEETMSEWQRRQDLEARLDRLEQAQRDAEAQYQTDQFNRRQAEALERWEESIKRDQIDAGMREDWQ